MPGARVESGERVTLRTVESEDVPFVQRASADSEIRYPLGNPVRTRAQVEASRDDESADRFLVCLEDDETPRGPRRRAKSAR